MKYVTFISWADAAHLDKDQQASLLAGIPPWLRESRTKGIPTLGTGSIYTVPENDFVINGIPLERHWPRCFALDVGWKINAALFGAIDRDTGTVYIYDEVYKAKSEPAVVAAAIRARGSWINGVIDPASRGRSQKDGIALLGVYRDLGLDVRPAVNTVEAGLLKVWEMLSQGQIKVFNTCQNFLAEYRLYRRDKKGDVVKANDHLMDCLRYMVMSGLDRAEIEPTKNPNGKNWYDYTAPPFWVG
jgi:hypothetical protein